MTYDRPPEQEPKRNALLREERTLLQARANFVWGYVYSGALVVALIGLLPNIPSPWRAFGTLIGLAIWFVGVLQQYAIAVQGLRLRRKDTLPPGSGIAARA